MVVVLGFVLAIVDVGCELDVEAVADETIDTVLLAVNSFRFACQEANDKYTHGYCETMRFWTFGKQIRSTELQIYL